VAELPTAKQGRHVHRERQAETALSLAG